MSATKHALILAEEYLEGAPWSDVRTDRFEQLVKLLNGDRWRAADFIHDVVKMRRENGQSVPKTY